MLPDSTAHTESLLTCVSWFWDPRLTAPALILSTSCAMFSCATAAASVSWTREPLEETRSLWTSCTRTWASLRMSSRCPAKLRCPAPSSVSLSRLPRVPAVVNMIVVSRPIRIPDREAVMSSRAWAF